ncbi:MAG: RidA family protein, partial [Burkholderiales bacterium]
PVQLSESVRAKLNVAAEQTNGTAHALQTVAAISALTRRVAAANGKLDNIVHVTVYIDDISHFKSTKEALEHAFGERRPALTVLEVPAPAPVRGARVSLSAIAYLGERQ